MTDDRSGSNSGSNSRDAFGDTSEDIHALSGAYAVDALDELERAHFERHLAGCPACQGEVAGLREAAAQLSATVEVTPPASLRDRVMHDITSVRPLPPVSRVSAPSTPDEPDPTRRVSAPSTGRRWNRGLLAAAAAVVIGAAGVGVWQAVDDRPQQTVAEQVLDAPDASRVSKTFPGGASATIVRSPALGKAVLVTSKMPAAPAGKVYQLWLQDGTGAMHSAGLMPTGSDQVVVLAGDAAAATAAGISVEPAGGSVEPTTDPIALFSFA